MRKIMIVIAVALGLFAGPAVTASASAAPVHSVRKMPVNPGPKGPFITEDDPRWDCRIMGNRICGVARDCRVRYYTSDTVKVCTRLWMQPERVETGDGYENTIPAGPTLVHECQADNKTNRSARSCFTGWL